MYLHRLRTLWIRKGHKVTWQQKKNLGTFPPWVSNCNSSMIIADIVRIRSQLPIRYHSASSPRIGITAHPNQHALNILSYSRIHFGIQGCHLALCCLFNFKPYPFPKIICFSQDSDLPRNPHISVSLVHPLLLFPTPAPPSERVLSRPILFPGHISSTKLPF